MSELQVKIVTIDAIQPHSNADKLELAIIKGWQCVVPKDRYKAGDAVVYIPLDSILPDKLSERLGIAQYMKQSKGCVRAVKLRGEKSFGVICDVEIASTKARNEFYQGKEINLAQELGITKYDPDAISKQGRTTRRKSARRLTIIQKLIIFRKKWKSIGWRQALKSLIRMFHLGFPLNNEVFNQYTRIDNFKDHPHLFDNIPFVITEKIHGMNFRAGWINGEWMVGSHFINLEEDANNRWWEMSRKYPLKEILKNNQIIYGEIYGGNVQKIKYGKKNPDILFFDMSEEVNGARKYVDFPTFEDFCMRNLLPIPPILSSGQSETAIKRAKEKCELPSLMDGRSVMEGFIIKPLKEQIHPKIGRLILKYKSDKFLFGGFE